MSNSRAFKTNQYTDYVGNNRVVADANGTAIQKNHYYPFGMAFADTPLVEQGKQPYKYNGKELDQMHGLNTYDYSARTMDPAISRFVSVDPLAEKYYSISPYAYVMNNPLRYIDKDGRDPGDPFKSPADAAKDFALYYNGTSIIRNREFVSMIYKITNGENFIYSYIPANIGTANKALIPIDAIPENSEVIAITHTHGKYDGLSPDPHKANNDFSATDKNVSNENKIDNYVATPDGTLKKYEPKTGNTTNIKIDNIPSDPRDPQRTNQIEPVDTKPKYNDPLEIDQVDKNKR